jgi:hypothetical protein
VEGSIGSYDETQSVQISEDAMVPVLQSVAVAVAAWSCGTCPVLLTRCLVDLTTS